MISFLENVLHLFNENSRKIAAAISVLLIILMSLSVSDTVLLVMETMDPPSGLPAQSGRAQGEKQTYIVSDLELFGKVQKAAAVPQVVNAPETSLNLELQGVFISEDDRSSTAIIGQKNKSGELYEIGDRIPGNAELTAVHEDHVLLRRNGRIEKLLFSDSKFRVQQPEAKAQPVASGQRNVTRDNLQRIRDRMRGSVEPGLADPASASAAVAQMRQRLMEDPAGTLASAGITPVREGEASGYRVGDDTPNAVKQSGLQPGDVILSVNGRPVGAATSDAAMMDQVMSASRARVEVQRGERRFFLTVPVPQ